MATADIGLIGRDSELSRLSHLVDAPPAASQIQVLLGEPGMGKTVLLAEVTRRARSAALRVLSVTGRESERDLAFAGLHRSHTHRVAERASRCWHKQAAIRSR